MGLQDLRAVLEQRRAALVDEESRLLEQVPSMEPLVAARALRRLADEMEELERDFEKLKDEEQRDGAAEER
ncbi:MAG: hypothetical protein HY319_15800 [Armatimonadetes bacterium]|nr:hypothetical protein [Armatimonadota bacterium]